MHVIVEKPVSNALGDILPRGPMLRVLNRLYDQLENHYDRYQNRRDPEDVDLFDYVIHFHDGEIWHTLRFSVNDREAQGFAFVEGVSHDFWQA
jgi:hypothetical protein